MADAEVMNEDIGPADVSSDPKGGTVDPTDKSDKQRWSEWRARFDACKIYRKKLVANWTINIDYRRGKPFASQTDEDRVVVNLDWSLTKAKQAALFSQIPQIHVTHPPQSQSAGSWLYSYEQRLNDTVNTAGVEAAMDECLVDCINAAGIGAVLVSHESISEDKQVPAIDLSMYPPGTAASGVLPDGSPIPMTTVPQVYDHRYCITRISPADLLWPINFTTSDFDKGPWIGRSGRCNWPVAKAWFKLTDDDKTACVGEDRSTLDRLTHDIDKDKITADEMVSFDEIFYKESEYDENVKSFSAIHHLVFVTGKDEPVIDEPWKGQDRTKAQDGTPGPITGAQKFPIRVLTLSYLTDETIPPSDTAIGRPQVNEINKSRTQMILQRERSLPIRQANINLIDPTILQNIMRGTWQNVIPVQGSGEVIKEVGRAAYPPENWQFDATAKNDLNEEWNTGANQQGEGTGVETAGEAKVIQSNAQTRIGRERAKVAKFFTSIAEVLGGLICLYEDAGSFGEGFDPMVSRTLSYSILPDTTVLIDSNQRLQRLIQFVNFGAKSGWVDIEPVMKEIAQLSGLDPNTVIKPPQPKPPVEPNISVRLTGSEDLLQPMTLALLMKSGQAPTPDLIEQAKQLIAISVQPPAPPPGSQPPMGPDGQPMPQGPPLPHDPNAMPLPPPGQEPVPPMPPTPRVGEANPRWSIMPTLQKRAEE